MEIRELILEYEIEDELPLSFGYKLRGFFANNFEHILFHHHQDDGSLRYKYPLIQYKIINNNPFVIALQEGCDVVTRNFLDIKELNINKKKYKNPTGKLKIKNKQLKVNDNFEMLPYLYEFFTPWVALNQKNYRKYIKKDQNKTLFLSKILIGNILSFAKGINWWIDNKVVVMPELNEIKVNFKGNNMLGFKGKFFSNVLLPDYIGLGKFASRGFGTIIRKDIE